MGHFIRHLTVNCDGENFTLDGRGDELLRGTGSLPVSNVCGNPLTGQEKQQLAALLLRLSCWDLEPRHLQEPFDTGVRIRVNS